MSSHEGGAQEVVVAVKDLSNWPAVLCAAANQVDVTGKPVSLRVPCAPTREAEDAFRLATDRTLRRIYPQVEPRTVVVAHNDLDFATVTLSASIQPPTPERHTADGVCNVFVDGAAPATEISDAKAGRKAYFKAHKEDLRECRAVLSALYAQNTFSKPRKVLMAPQGIAYTAGVVAADDLYAYLAVRESMTSDAMVVVGRIPSVAGLKKNGASAATTAPRPPGWLRNAEGAYLLQHVQRGFGYVAASARASLTTLDVTSHRISFRFRQEEIDWNAIEAEDCYVASAEPRTADDISSVHDLSETVKAAHDDALAAYKSDAAVRGRVDALRNTSEYRSKRAPGAIRALLKARDAILTLPRARRGEIINAREGPQVELKAKVNIADNTTSGGADPASAEPATWRSAQTNTARLRQIMAAMANTHGGVIVVGVADDGTVLGAPKIATHLRLSNFAPAMIPEAVSCRELPVLAETTTAAAGPAVGAPNGGGSPQQQPARRTMPANWWVLGPAAAAATPSAAGGASAAVKSVAADGGSESVVTVISVVAAAAPFHLTGSSVDSAPMARGCASTIPLSATACVERLLADVYEQREQKRLRDGLD